MKKLFIIFILGVILTACSTEKTHKTEKNGTKNISHRKITINIRRTC
jgi:uncharacterized protein YceK